MEKVLKAGIYVRVSTLEQALHGYSIGEQQARLISYAKAQAYEIADIYSDEGVSGKSLVRPAIDRLINDIKANKIDIVLIYKLDRLSRRVKDVLELVELFEQYGVTLYSLNENIDLSSPFGRASLKMSATFSELERETIVERMQMGKDARAKQGKYSCPGKCPYGYKLDRETSSLTLAEEESEVVADAFNTYASQDMSIRKLYDYLSEKYPTTTLLTDAMSFRRLLKNPIYTGYFTHKGELVKATNVPAIIGYDVYLQVQKALDEKRTERHRDSSPYLLTGLMFCARCGSTYVAKSRTNTKNGTKHYFYKQYGCTQRIKYDFRLKDKARCDNDNYSAEWLEGYIEKAVMNLKFTQFTTPVSSTNLINSLLLENAELKKQKEKLLDLYLAGAIDKSTLISRTDGLDKKISHNSTVIEKEQHEIAIAPTVDISYLLERQKAYPTSTIQEKRQLLRLLIKQIVIDGNKINIFWNVK